MAYMDSYYVLSLNILKALGGDTSIVYPDADAIWDEINKIYNNAGNRFDIVPLEKNITENGQYDYYPDGDADAFMPVNINVNVPQKYTDEQVFEIESNAIQQGYNHGYTEGEADGKLTGREEGYTDGYNTGYGTGVTDGGNAQKAKLVDITITENGTYTKEDGYKTVTVEVEAGIPEEELQQMLQDAMDEGYQDGYAEGVDDGREDGIAEQKEKLESTTFTENGTYTKEDGWNSVTVEVDVPTFETETLTVELKSNGNYNYTPTTDGYSSVSVTVDVDTSSDGTKPKIYNGIIVFPSDGTLSSTKSVLSNMDFSKYDWSKVYDGYYFLANLNEPGTDGWANFEENFNGRFLSGNYMFSNISSNTYAMTTLPNIKEKMDGILTMRGMFQKNKKIRGYQAIADWDTSKCVDTSNMFLECQNAAIFLFDVSSVVTAESMFNAAKQGTTIPQYNFEKLINASSMFKNCTELKNISEFNTSNIRFADYMFYYCTNISVMPELNWENLRNCYNMFGYTKFTELPNMNTKNVVTFGTSTSTSWLYENRSITKMGIIDCDSCVNIGYVLSPNTTTMTELGGFRNLGKMPSLIGCDGSYFLSKQPNLTYDSIMNVINLLYDRKSAGYSVLTLKLHANHLAMLSDDDIAIATNKGWTIA